MVYNFPFNSHLSETETAVFKLTYSTTSPSPPRNEWINRHKHTQIHKHTYKPTQLYVFLSFSPYAVPRSYQKGTTWIIKRLGT